MDSNVFGDSKKRMKITLSSEMNENEVNEFVTSNIEVINSDESTIIHFLETLLNMGNFECFFDLCNSYLVTYANNLSSNFLELITAFIYNHSQDTLMNNLKFSQILVNVCQKLNIQNKYEEAIKHLVDYLLKTNQIHFITPIHVTLFEIVIKLNDYQAINFILKDRDVLFHLSPHFEQNNSSTLIIDFLTKLAVIKTNIKQFDESTIIYQCLLEFTHNNNDYRPYFKEWLFKYVICSFIAHSKIIDESFNFSTLFDYLNEKEFSFLHYIVTKNIDHLSTKQLKILVDNCKEELKSLEYVYDLCLIFIEKVKLFHFIKICKHYRSVQLSKVLEIIDDEYDIESLKKWILSKNNIGLTISFQVSKENEYLVIEFNNYFLSLCSKESNFI